VKHSVIRIWNLKRAMRNITNVEWAQAIGDDQEMPDMRDTGPSDMGAVQVSIQDLDRTPLGEPHVEFDVRCIYDSRPVNGYDFNYSATTTNVTTGSWQVTFNVPNGYRIVPREWEIIYDVPPSGPSANSTVTIQQNSANLPNNGPIIIGMGTSAPIKTFFICEENTTFGIIGRNTNLISGTNTVIINVYGNLLSVTDVALPFAVTNRKI
jgi:hypothetical protein